MKIRKKVTPAKKAANQDNAKDSTGPTSIPGKERASRNAISHGIFARDMLLPGESEKEFKQLRSDIISSKGPVGADEFFQVEIMVCTGWRLKRVYRAEAGGIAKLLTDHEPADMVTSAHTSQYNQALTDLIKLNEIEAQVDSEARVSTEDMDWLRNLAYGEPVQRVGTSSRSCKPMSVRKAHVQALECPFQQEAGDQRMRRTPPRPRRRGSGSSPAPCC